MGRTTGPDVNLAQSFFLTRTLLAEISLPGLAGDDWVSLTLHVGS